MKKILAALVVSAVAVAGAYAAEFSDLAVKSSDLAAAVTEAAETQDLESAVPEIKFSKALTKDTIVRLLTDRDPEMRLAMLRSLRLEVRDPDVLYEVLT